MNAFALMEAFGDLSEADIARELAYQPQKKAGAAASIAEKDAVPAEPAAETVQRLPVRLLRWGTLAACLTLTAGFVYLLASISRAPDSMSSQVSESEQTTASVSGMTAAVPAGTTTTLLTTAAPAPTGTTASGQGSAPESAAADAQQAQDPDATDSTERAQSGTGQRAGSATTTSGTTTAVTTAPPERRTDFRAVLGHMSGGISFFEGDEPDYSKLELALHLEDQWGSFGHQIGSFSIGSGKHAHCYTIDTSEVDPNTPGTYYMYVDTVAGAEDDFDSFSEIPQIGLTRGTIHVTMEAHRTSFMVTVMKKNTDLSIACGARNQNDEYVRPVTDSGIADFFTVYNLWENNDSAEYTFSDPTVAEIVDKNMDANGCNQILRVNCLKAGETKLTVTAADGRTASCLIRVIPREEYFTEPAFTTSTTAETAIWTEAASHTTVTDEKGRFRDEDGNIIIEHNGTTMKLNPGTADDDLSRSTTETTYTTATDEKGRILDENGDVLIINGTSAVVSGNITDIVLPDNDWGNANCKDGTDISDAVLIARYIVQDKAAAITDQGLANADLTHDGNVDGEDLSRLMLFLGRIITFDDLKA